MLLHSQLKRVLAHLPEQERRSTPRPEPVMGARFGFQADGTWRGTFVLPADQGAIAQRALESAHQALFAERSQDADPGTRGPVTSSDAYLRMSETALDALDPEAARTGVRGERAQVIVHLDARSNGDGQARLHLGPQLPDPLRRFLTCDAKVRAMLEDARGALLGISPQEPTVNRRLRRIVEQTRRRLPLPRLQPDPLGPGPPPGPSGRRRPHRRLEPGLPVPAPPPSPPPRRLRDHREP